MSDTYVECLVKAKPSILGRFFKVLLIVLTVIFTLVFMVLGPMIPFLIFVPVLTGAGAYFVNMFTDLEYEYLYLDRELTVDKVMAKTKRKRMAVYSLEKIEILAPIKSYHLDNYKNRTAKEIDYSIGEELKPDKRYVMYYEGSQKIILSPSEDMIKVMRNMSPRKVYAD